MTYFRVSTIISYNSCPTSVAVENKYHETMKGGIRSTVKDEELFLKKDT
jgi:hypothetical protein